MPTDRPFRSNSLDDLFGQAKRHWSNLRFLQLVIDELEHRTTATARKLHAEIGERIAELLEAERRKGDECCGTDLGALKEELDRLRAEKKTADMKLAELQAVLLQARDTIRLQERKLAALSTGGGDSLYRRVGLDNACPDFVLKAARTAYRKQLHPDTRPQHEKAEAERRFKEAEAVFERLLALRKNGTV
jgi:hypothetical protein